MPRVIAIHPGPASFRQAQVREHQPLLRALGIEIVLADDYVTDEDRELFAAVVEIPSAEHVTESLAILERWCAAHTVDGVLAQSEAGACVGSLLAAKLGVPALSPRAALLTTSKYLCRRELLRRGVPQPRFALAHDAAGVRAFARESGFPVVLKAHASALARLVALVASDLEVDAAVLRMRAMLPVSSDVQRLVSFARAAGLDLECDPTRDFLVEEFAHGAALETDGVVFGERILTFGVTGQVLSKPPLFFMEGYLLPADHGPDERAHVEAVSDAALRALGVTSSGFSIEMRLERGAARVIEVNGRLGWDEGFGDLFAAATGGQPALQALAVALGMEPKVERQHDVHYALAYQSCYEDKIVARVPTDAELALLAQESDVAVGLATYEGQRMYAPPHPDVTPHVAWALATDERSSRAAYERAARVARRIDVRLEAPAR